MQGLSLGPADLAADRRMKTTRVGGGHPGYLVRQDPVAEHPDAHRAIFQQDLWHYTIARMVDACATHGIYPYYGPFGDIADVVARKIQKRNDYIKRHMMQCGTCLSNMITTGLLVDIRDHWNSEGSFGFRAGMS